MVSDLSIIFMFVSLVIAFLFPIGLVIFMYRRYRISLRAVFVGALVFFVFQGIIRIPLLAYFGNQSWYISLAQNTFLTALFLGLTAGIFEEVGRLIGIKLFLKKHLSWKNGVAFGIGHGGIEAILLLGMNSLANLMYSSLINTGSFDTVIGSKISGELAAQIKNTLISAPSYMFLVGGIERIFAITIQIGLSLIIFYAVMKRRYIYVLYAILLHALIDSPIVFMQKFGVFAAEGYTLLWAMISLAFIVKSRDVFKPLEK